MSRPPHTRESSREEGYPSWLPKRPGPPVPHSTLPSSLGHNDLPDPSDAHDALEDLPPQAGLHGRRATQRSVRIVSMSEPEKDDEGRREPTDTTRVSQPLHSRAYSKATAHGLSSSLLASSPLLGVPRPRFRAQALHLELLRSPSVLMRLRFYLYPLFVFAHIPLQTFLDFNVIFILVQ